MKEDVLLIQHENDGRISVRYRCRNCGNVHTEVFFEDEFDEKDLEKLVEFCYSCKGEDSMFCTRIKRWVVCGFDCVECPQSI